ncbi:MAG: hypothetical protein Q4B80_00590 [Aerococcaceae bacterium]|nr:hypothetical protein [Aerococcaceae bacterium]
MSPEQFRKHLTKKILWCRVSAGLLTVVSLVVGFQLKNSHDLARGYVTGLALVAAVMSLVEQHRIQQALRNPQQFEAYYIEQTDERKGYLQQKVASTTYYANAILLEVAMLIAIFINHDVFLALFALVMVQAFCKVVIKKYYATKY